MTVFTDYLGNPVAERDIIIYPSASGSSSAENNLARVEEIIPLVLRQSPWGQGTQWVREDQQHKHDATSYRPVTRDWRSRKVDPEKAYVMRVARYDKAAGFSDRLHFIKNVDRVTVVTSLTSVR